MEEPRQSRVRVWVEPALLPYLYPRNNSQAYTPPPGEVQAAIDSFKFLAGPFELVSNPALGSSFNMLAQVQVLQARVNRAQNAEPEAALHFTEEAIKEIHNLIGQLLAYFGERIKDLKNKGSLVEEAVCMVEEVQNLYEKGEMIEFVKLAENVHQLLKKLTSATLCSPVSGDGSKVSEPTIL